MSATEATADGAGSAMPEEVFLVIFQCSEYSKNANSC